LGDSQEQDQTDTMQIVYHLGAHCTDEDRLVRGLLKNRATLLDMGIVVPTPRQYRQILPRMAKSLKGGPASPEIQEVILDAVMEEDEAQRLIFSSDALICFPINAISDHGFYDQLAQRIQSYRNFFPDAQNEFYLSLRNPATLVPALISRVKDATYHSIMGSNDPLDLRWAPTIRQSVTALPDVSLTVWCNEDTPLLWPELVRNLAGLDGNAVLEGDFDLLAAIMTDEGLERLKSYLESHPPQTIDQRRQITSAFLGKYALEEEIEQEIEIPGWTAELIAEITEAYEADMAEIATMPGVNFIAP
jgi:hypothetical protein